MPVRWRSLTDVLSPTSLAVAAVAAALVIASCGGDDVPIPTTLTEEEAAGALDSIILRVEMPDLSMDVGTTNLPFFQDAILNGHEHPPTQGLFGASLALDENGLSTFCMTVGTIIANTFVNKIMEDTSRDPVQLTPLEVDEHDPKGLFLGRREAEIMFMGSPVAVRRDDVGLDGDVMSGLWKDDALALMDLVYGLGQQCVDAAKAESR